MRTPLKFIKLSLFIVGAICLLFIMFTAIFAGRPHALRPAEGYGLGWMSADILIGLIVPILILVASAFLIYLVGAGRFWKREEEETIDVS